MEVFERLRVEPELAHVELQVALVEQPHDDLLAPQRRQRRHAEVHLAALAELELDATVLRETALGDVERRHDLDAADDGVLQLDGGRHLLGEHAVDAVAHPELLLVRLDVDVARALLDGVEQHHVDQADDRRVLAGLLELEEVGRVVLVAGELDLGLVETGHDLVVRGPRVVVLLDRRVDRGLARDDRLDVVAGEKLQVVDRVEVRRVGHRDDERVARSRDREHLVPLARLLGHELEHVGIDLVLFEVDGGDAVLLAEKAGDLVVADVPELRERVAEVVARLLLLVLRVPKLRKGDELLADEELSQPVVVGHAASALEAEGPAAKDPMSPSSVKSIESHGRAAGGEGGTG